MKHMMKNPLKPGSIALGLGLMLTTLCYGQAFGPYLVPNVGMSESPSAVLLPNGGISVFHQGLGNNGTLWWSYWDGSNWSPDTQVQNVGMTASPSAVVFPNGGISVFHQGLYHDAQLWYSYYDGAQWYPDTLVPNVFMTGSPSAVVFPNGGISVFHQGLGNNGTLWYSNVVGFAGTGGC